MASSSGSTKVCFNSTCNEALEVPKQGWLCRTGDFADLCDRCASAFKDGNFCDTYHLNASGWRSCESCGKQIHCGCIVSFHMFILLDAGGIECLNCAKTEYILTPNPTWPSASPFLAGPAERIRDISSKNWRSIAGSSPVPWRQAPSLMTASKPQPELQSRTAFVVDILSSIDKPRERLTSCSLGKRTTEDHSDCVTNENRRVCASEMTGDSARTTSVQCVGQHNLFGDTSYQSFFNANELVTPLSTLPATFVAHDKKSEKIRTSGVQWVGKRCSNDNGSHDQKTFVAQDQESEKLRTSRPCVQWIGKSENIRTSGSGIKWIGKWCSNDNGSQDQKTFVAQDQESEKLRTSRPRVKWLGSHCYFDNGSHDQKTFVAHDQKSEKPRASSSHIQWIGRRCSNYNETGPSVGAQAHNAKSQSETRVRHQPLPRYWPRITDQELQQISGSSNAKITPLFEKVLSASDAGRIGRLVLPKKCAEAYLPPISQPEGYPLVVQDLKGKDWVLQFRYWPNNNSRMYVLEGVTPCIQSMQLQAGDTVTFSRLEPEGKLVMGFRKASRASPSYQGNETTTTRICTHEESLGSVAFKSKSPDSARLEGDKISIGARSKKAKMCSDSKNLKLNDREMFKLNVTLEQLQGLLRPPLTTTPTIMLIEGVEFEDFQESPVIGSPTICSTNHVESLCSPVVEATPERLKHMLPMISHASVKKNNSENPESVETMEGLDELADLAIQDGSAIAASSQPTTRHPHHKPGCTCIICIQPPSSTKHKSTCTCNVCLAVKHLMKMMHHDQKHSDKEAGNFVRNPPELLCNQVGNSNQNHKEGPSDSFENDPNGENSSTPSFKSQNIDLNIQPEREEEACPVSDLMGTKRLSQESITQMTEAINQ